jgi:hypothetical protein
MVLYSLAPNAYSSYDESSGSEVIYLLDGRLYYLYKTTAIQKIVEAEWSVQKGEWGIATVSRFYSAADRTH